ncbi:hypothetical protein [Thalassospira xiamenensis]|uniref:hypothetical protein n=1 Tax=Thalassospira xiamenensis TaxID=220697 RepID=UPI001FFF4874|nr:hypothetical protein [Thalassospira xiamenensis]MCK2165136.1 hypothetical protein [Thalassospira xiamenensis]
MLKSEVKKSNDSLKCVRAVSRFIKCCNDPLVIEKRKDFWWNILSFILSIFMLGSGVFFALILLDDVDGFEEKMRLVTISFGFPIFFILSIYKRIESQTIGLIISAVIAFIIGTSIQ